MEPGYGGEPSVISLGEDKVVLSFPGEAGTAPLERQDFPLVAFWKVGVLSVQLEFGRSNTNRSPA